MESDEATRLPPLPPRHKDP